MILRRGILVAIVFWGAACSRAAPSSSAPPVSASQPAATVQTSRYPWRLARWTARPQGPCRQRDDRREGPPRPTAVLRHAVFGQRNVLVCIVPPAESSLHRRPRACTRFDRRPASAQRHVVDQRGVQLDVRMGGRPRAHARGADGGADVQRAPGRDGDQRKRGGNRGAVCLESRGRGIVCRSVPGRCTLRSRSTTPSRRSPRSSGR